MSHIRLKTEYEVEGSYGSRDKAILYADRNYSCDVTTFFYEDGTPICSFEDADHPNLLDAMNELNTGMPETNPKIQWAQIPDYVEPEQPILTNIGIEIMGWKELDGMRPLLTNMDLTERKEGRQYKNPKTGHVLVFFTAEDPATIYKMQDIPGKPIDIFRGKIKSMSQLRILMEMINE